VSIRSSRQRRDFQGVQPGSLIPPRGSGRYGNALVNEDTVLRNSAAWACMRLRADLISTLPLTVTMRVQGENIAMPPSPILVAPGGERWDYMDWMWATQHDLDRVGNSIGLITEVNALGLPARIDLQPSRICTVIMRKGQPEPIYKIDQKEYPASKVWHERQYPVAGLPVGLSPVAVAAYSIGEGLSLQQFATDWFAGGAVPKAYMRNKAKTLITKEVTEAKQWYRDVMTNGDLLVFGNDWEYDMIQAEQAGVEWIQGRQNNVIDIARYFGCPADLIDGAVSGQAVTYANISQRDLQFLIMNLGPAVSRRERTLTKLIPARRNVVLDTDALLRMDPMTRAQYAKIRIDSRTLAPSEVRRGEGEAPFTQAQKDEFTELFPPKTATSPPERVASAPTTAEIRAALDDWLAVDNAPRSPLPIGG
jgi:HK97 family phage portal protein